MSDHGACDLCGLDVGVSGDLFMGSVDFGDSVVAGHVLAQVAANLRQSEQVAVRQGAEIGDVDPLGHKPAPDIT